MPTIDRRNRDNAYYILANPGDRGNITYQVERDAYPILNADPEITPGEEISWPKIKALQALGVIYTENSGTIYPKDHPAPDPESIEEGGDGQSLTITSDRAESFFETITDNWSFTEDQRSEVRHWLGLDTEKAGSLPNSGGKQERATVETLERHLQEQLDQPEIGDIEIGSGFELEQHSVAVSEEPAQDHPHDEATHIVIATHTFHENASGQMEYCSLHIGVNRGEGLAGITIVGDSLPPAEYPKAMALTARRLSEVQQILVELGWLPSADDKPHVSRMDISLHSVNSGDR